MSDEELFDYKEIKIDLEKVLQIIFTHLDNPFEREEILKATYILLQESQGILESLSESHEDLQDQLLFYQQTRYQEHARAGRLKRLFSFCTTQDDVQQEAFQKALRDTRQMRQTLSLSQDPAVTQIVQTYTQLIISLRELLLDRVSESEEGKELSKELIQKLFKQILGEEIG